MNEDISENNIAKALRRIYTAEKDDVACDDAAVLMARMADSISQAAEPEAVPPALKRHLDVCEECAFEYQIILDLARLADEQPIQSIQIPDRPDKKDLLKMVEEVIENLFDFPGFNRLVGGPVRGAGLDVAPVEIDLSGGLLLEIDVALHPNDSALRDIFVSVQSTETESDVDLEGVSVTLAQVEENKNIASGMLDRYGEAVLAAVEPGVLYFLQVEIASQINRIQQIKLP